VKIGILKYDFEESGWFLSEERHPYVTKAIFPFNKFDEQYYDPTLEGRKTIIDYCPDDGNWYIISVEL
jgi:hypothetical protein